MERLAEERILVAFIVHEHIAHCMHHHCVRTGAKVLQNQNIQTVCQVLMNKPPCQGTSLWILVVCQKRSDPQSGYCTFLCKQEVQLHKLCTPIESNFDVHVNTLNHNCRLMDKIVSPPWDDG